MAPLARTTSFHSKTGTAVLREIPGISNERKIAIVGAGGHARETMLLILQCGLSRDDIAGFFVDEAYWSEAIVQGLPLQRLTAFDPGAHQAIVAIGDSRVRRDVVASLPATTHFPSLVHPSVIAPDDLSLPEGVMIHAGCIITTDVSFGRHVQLNRATQVGHDCVLEEFVTTAPGAVISGNCTIGANSYLGAMSCIREKQRIGTDAMVGMGAVVVSDVPANSIYVGNPARAMARLCS